MPQSAVPLWKSWLAAMGSAVLTGSLAFSLAAGSEGKKPDAAAKPATPGDVAAGKKLFKIHCAVCHFAQASTVKVGPGMKGLFEQKELPHSGLAVTEKNVRNRIKEGNPEPGKNFMPAYRDILSPAQVQDLVAYLKTL